MVPSKQGLGQPVGLKQEASSRMWQNRLWTRLLLRRASGGSLVPSQKELVCPASLN